MRIRNKTAAEVEAAAEKGSMAEKAPSLLFSTGDTTLNLACSDSTKGAFPPGVLVNIVGDSHAGKTFLAHSILAEATINPEFAHYRLIYDNAEASDTTGIVKMFGKETLSHIETPNMGRSTTINDFKINIWKFLREEKPFIYILDSLDSISSEEEEAQMDALADDKKTKGSYGMEKAKALSKALGLICDKLEKTKSLLIVLSQTRDKINSSFHEKTRSGGRALKFYSFFEMWLAVVDDHVKTSGEFTRVVGHQTRVKITKNKLTGKVREANINIYDDYGVDDLGTCVDFMVDGKFWSMRKNTILATDLGIEATRDKLIRLIEEKELEPKLKHLVGKAWKKVEDDVRLDRKAKYQ